MCVTEQAHLIPGRIEEMGGGYVLFSSFKLKSWQMTMLALLLMVGSFYAGTLFGQNPNYVSQISYNSYNYSIPGMLTLA